MSQLTVKSIHKTNIDDPTDPRNMTIVVEGDGSLDVAPVQGIGSLIYQPVAAPAGVTPARPYLTLVPPAAEQDHECDRRHPERQGLRPDLCRHLPHSPVAGSCEQGPSIHLARLVGLFLAAHSGLKDIVHPVGMCLMRNSGHRPEIPDEGEPPPSPGELLLRGVSALCPVCRFALVDYVDPEQHFLNNLDYDKWYPF